MVCTVPGKGMDAGVWGANKVGSQDTHTQYFEKEEELWNTAISQKGNNIKGEFRLGEFSSTLLWFYNTN